MGDNPEMYVPKSPEKDSLLRQKIHLISSNEKIRFLIVGGLNTVVGLLVFYATQYFFGKYITYIGSVLFAHFLVSGFGFFLYRRFVFKVSGNVMLDFLRFQSVYSFSLISNLVILPILVSACGWNVYIAQTVTVLIVTVVSFIGHKFFSFRRAQ